MKKLKLDVESLAVDSFPVDDGGARGGTVHGQAVWTWWWSACDTCDKTCDPAVATCGATCGPACQWTKNTPDCYTVSCPAQTYCDVTVCIKWTIEQAMVATPEQ